MNATLEALAPASKYARFGTVAEILEDVHDRLLAGGLICGAEALAISRRIAEIDAASPAADPGLLLDPDSPCPLCGTYHEEVGEPFTWDSWTDEDTWTLAPSIDGESRGGAGQDLGPCDPEDAD